MSATNETAEELRPGGARHRADGHVTAVYDYLLKRIDDGSLPPGARLPTERELCEHFGFARHSVRKALATLESAGRIVRYVGRGTFVKEGYAALCRFHSRAAEICSPAEVIEACLLIEPQMAYVAALRAVPLDFQRLEECVDSARLAKTTGEFEKWDNRFHTAIVETSRNNFLINLYEGISHVRREDDWSRLKERTMTDETRADYVRHLEGILEAIRNRAPAAAEEAMRSHLLAVQADLSP